MHLDLPRGSIQLLVRDNVRPRERTLTWLRGRCPTTGQGPRKVLLCLRVIKPDKFTIRSKIQVVNVQILFSCDLGKNGMLVICNDIALLIKCTTLHECESYRVSLRHYPYPIISIQIMIVAQSLQRARPISLFAKAQN